MHVGPLVRRLQASRSYGFVLLLVLFNFVFLAASPDEAWPRAVLIVLQALTLAVALWTSAATGRLDTIAVALVVIGVAGAITALVTESANATGVLGLVGVALIASTCAVIILGIRDQHGVNVQSVLGALCIYLLIGMLYTFTYGAIAALESSPFFAQGTDGTPSIRLYFSLVTMSTVGYGDYSAATDLGRTVAASEALLGQIYLVTVVAVIVSRLRPSRPARTNEQ
jgi:Ion channel